MNGNTNVHGIVNYAYVAMEALRERAVAGGLSASAARAGIYGVTSRWSDVRDRSGVGHRLDESLYALI